MTELRFGAASDTGLVRKTNEDSMLHAPPLFAIADGMGGHSAGDVASKIAIDILIEQAGGGDDALLSAFHEANRAIFKQAREQPGQTGMGTTLTAISVRGNSAQVVHVGDSRAYLLRSGELTRLTEDHTVVARLVAQGRISAEEADHHPKRSWLERALGNAAEVDLDVKVIDTELGDRIMLCSDGLYGMLDELTIKQTLETEADPDKASRRLCDEAVNAGGHDNVSVIVIDYPPHAAVQAALPNPESQRKRTRWPRTIPVALVLLLTALLGGRSLIKGQWYVGDDSGRVTIFNGVKGTFLGIELSKPHEATSLRVNDLPSLHRSRVITGMPADDLTDARQIVANLRRIAARTDPAP